MPLPHPLSSRRRALQDRGAAPRSDWSRSPDGVPSRVTRPPPTGGADHAIDQLAARTERPVRDVLVLGAGMAGVGAALHLQSRGWTVALVDRS
ncbi:FAD-dependent oxidoreductase, partial [Methylobacterium frigidaeris]|uniref:FAD-dependent oxidoreductase n=1 Tax=Methylobacterium frigidaeris TaxID=2038277 RepID=UPI003CC828A9